MAEERQLVGRSVVVGSDTDNDGFALERPSAWEEAGFVGEHAAACERGYTLGEELRGRSWDEVAADARARWELDRPGTWDRFEAAIRHGWRQATDPGGPSTDPGGP